MSMDTRSIAAEYRLAHWAQIMRERSESRLNIRAFCENAGIHVNTYYYWQRKLRETACQGFSVVQAKIAQTGLINTGFAEVKLLDPQRQITPHQEDGLNGSLIIEVSRARLTADGEYPVEKLSYLLRTLVGQ